VLGLLGGSSASVDFSRLLRRRQQLLGLVMRTRSLADKTRITRAFVRETLPLFEDGRLQPLIDSVFPLAEAARAHRRMEQNANIGKIVLCVAGAPADLP
jgi:NADPH:quinone reductase-like Zn-dependent oxidoreductase